MDAAPAPERAYDRFYYWLTLAGVLGWVVSALPTRSMPFRVEQWDVYEFYANRRFNPTSLHEWLVMAFWTPFGDFRFTPGAYLWNVLAFKALGPGNLGLWILSIALNLANAYLVAWWVSLLIGRRSPRAGAIAALFYLLFPARQEIVLWTLFTYKLVASGLTLFSLVMLERSERGTRRRELSIASAAMFVAWTFYEAGLPLGLLLPLRGVIMGDADWRQQAARIGRAVAPIYGLYALLSVAAWRWIPDALDLHGAIPGVRPAPVAFITSLWNWLDHGILTGNSGLPVVWIATPFHLLFSVDHDSAIQAMVLVAWPLALLAVDWRRLPWRAGAFVMLVGGACNGAVWIGRTISNGTQYLSYVSMYQHLPSTVLAALLGVALGAYSQRNPPKRWLTLLGRIGVALVAALLSLSCRDAMLGYLRAQQPLRAALSVVEGRIAEAHGAPVRVDDVPIPFAPTWALSSAEHSYHVFHLLHGARIAPPPTRERRGIEPAARR